MVLFPIEAVIIRFVSATLPKQDFEWTVHRSRSITLESTAPLGDDPPVSLPTLAT